MSHISLFEEKQVRRAWSADQQEWLFAIVDVIAILTNSPNPQTYWRVMKKRLKDEGNESVTNCNALKMTAADGKQRLTDVAGTELLMRLIQSIPSPNAEPFKLWLAKVGYERMQEMSDPALSLERARATWQKHGRSDKWIQQRMTGQETRNKLNDYWASHEIKKGGEYAILTNLIHQEWSGVSVKSHKELKNLNTQNLRDDMSEAELIFTALAELSTRQIAETTAATGMSENQTAAKNGSTIAKNARLELEKQTGKSIVTGENYLPPDPSKILRDFLTRVFFRNLSLCAFAT